MAGTAIALLAIFPVTVTVLNLIQLGRYDLLSDAVNHSRNGRKYMPLAKLAQGVDQRVVMEILGHSQISMTTRYTHVLPDVMTTAADRIGQALWGSS